MKRENGPGDIHIQETTVNNKLSMSIFEPIYCEKGISPSNQKGTPF